MATTITPFDAENAAVTKLYQWDVGITLYITNSKITEAYNVHFANKTCTEAYSCSSTYSDGVLSVTVPNILLQQAYPISGYIYAEDEDYGRTVFTFKIRVIARPQPADYVYEESADYILVSDLAERIATLESGSVSEETISAAVTAYLEENGISIDLSDYSTTEEMAAAIAAAIAEIDIPDTLPNPYPLTVNGTSYDGSEAVTLTISSGGSSGSSISVTATDNGYILTIDGVDYEITNGTDGTDGTDGADGTNGTDGADGTSAYDAAVAGGYSGTETEFNAALATILAMANAEEVSY